MVPLESVSFSLSIYWMPFSENGQEDMKGDLMDMSYSLLRKKNQRNECGGTGNRCLTTAGYDRTGKL